MADLFYSGEMRNIIKLDAPITDEEVFELYRRGMEEYSAISKKLVMQFHSPQDISEGIIYDSNMISIMGYTSNTTTSRIKLDMDVLSNLTDFTIVTFFKEHDSINSHHIFKKESDTFFLHATSNYYEFHIYGNSDDGVVQRNIDNVELLAICEYQYNGDNTYNIILEIDRTYKNSSLANSSRRKINNNKICYIGMTANSMDGTIRDFRIYPRLLTEVEKDIIYRRGIKFRDNGELIIRGEFDER